MSRQRQDPGRAQQDRQRQQDRQGQQDCLERQRLQPVSHPARWLIIALLGLLLGCQTQPGSVSGPEMATNQLQPLVDANNWEAIAATRVNCRQSTEDCAEAHAIHADASLRLAIQLPPEASATRGRTRKLLDAAESGYRQALALQPSPQSPSLASYHGGLLLTLSERRNRLDASVREQRLDRENQKLLAAAEVARVQVPDSALGFIYGASALVYHALLKDSGGDRCAGLAQAEAMLKRSPTPPAELLKDQQRLKTLIQRSKQESRCAPTRR
jgi:hypothetical protein